MPQSSPVSSPLPSQPLVYLTPEQAGQVLSLSPRTLEKLRSIGGGPRYRKLGRRIRYTQADLDAWANARSFENTSEPGYFRRR